jgi:DNA-binding NtrC family response regulator
MNKKLLIIDSELFYREIMNRIFRSTYSVGFAKSVNEVGEVMKSFKPGVVFFELRQADRDQLTLVFSALKKFSSDSPLIVVVSENNRELERYARCNNIFYYMLRPFNLKELWDTIEYAFIAYEKNRINNWHKIPIQSTKILDKSADL